MSKTFLRWIYALLAYLLVTVGLWFGIGSYIDQSTNYPVELLNLVGGLGGGLSIWIWEVRLTILYLAAGSFVLFCLWNVVMCSKAWGRFPQCERASLYHILFLLLHVVVEVAIVNWRLGSVISFFLSQQVSAIFIYCSTLIVYWVLFFFVARILSPKTCYKFKHLWVVRKWLRLL